MPSPITTTQTIGPFSHEAWRWAQEASATVHASAATVTINTVIYDGAGELINDAQIEAWLPDAAASEASHALPGFRRIASDENGGFRLVLSLPDGPLAGRPAAYITVFARGLGKHQFTAVFLADDPALADSEILHQIPMERRATLIAREVDNAIYDWEIRMQGPAETAFFDYL